MERLPCKKCGKTNGRVIRYASDHPVIALAQRKKSTYRISCPNCGYATKEKQTIEEADHAWNQR